MDCIVHGVEKSWTQLSAFTFHFARMLGTLPSMINTYLLCFVQQSYK